MLRSNQISSSTARICGSLNLRNHEEDPDELQSYEDMVGGGGGSGGAGERASSYGGPGEKACADDLLLCGPERVGAVAEYRGSEKFGWQDGAGRVGRYVGVFDGCAGEISGTSHHRNQTHF